MFGVIPEGHPRPEPLLLPLPPDDVPRPRPGIAGGPAVIEPDPRALPLHVIGPGMFTIPHGPVLSGVVESVEYLVETPGEDIPHLNMRVFYKHRGIEKRFEGMTPADGALLAERVEGTAAVAHALAFCHALERICDAAVPWPAALVRTLHAEVERLACHLDVAVRLADAARAGGSHRQVRLAQGADAADGQPAVRQQIRPRGGRAGRSQQPATDHAR